MKKYTWRVSPAPSGRYRSFDKRCWPSAEYNNQNLAPCAMISCDDEYVPRNVKSGNHAELTVRIADHSVTPWKWRTFKQRFTTLDKAKKGVDLFLAAHPEYMPKDVQEGTNQRNPLNFIR